MNSDLFSMTIRWYRTPTRAVVCRFFGESCVELLWLRAMSKLAPHRIREAVSSDGVSWRELSFSLPMNSG